MKKITKRKIYRNGKLKSQIVYSKEIAWGYHDTRYYKQMESYIRDYIPNKEKEKRKFATPKRKHTDLLIKHYKTLLYKKTQGVFATLQGIYNKNKKAAESGQLEKKNSNLLYLVCQRC